MKMMKAQVVESPYKMVFKDVPVPQISDDEVLVKVKYCGICGSDWSIFTVKYAAEKLPLITGHEFWGTIEEMGKNVTGLNVGDRVAIDICLCCKTCYFCRRGDGLLCQTFTQLGIHTNGGFAEYVKAPAVNCYIIPDEIDDHAATFIEPLTTAIEASKRMGCELGSSVVVIGCGLGIIHANIAKLRGAAPIIIIGDNPNRLAVAKKMGIDHCIDINITPDAVAEVMKLTNGIGADYVIEAVGMPKTYEQAFAMLRRGGKIQAFGICAPGDAASLPPYEFVLGEKKVSGSCAGIGFDWGIAINLLKHKRIDPSGMYSMIVPLNELESALNELQTNKELIKVFVSPDITERVILTRSSTSG
jgi:threonine dehydrogenase-like Zn-dependent dehydrogenase